MTIGDENVVAWLDEGGISWDTYEEALKFCVPPELPRGLIPQSAYAELAEELASYKADTQKLRDTIGDSPAAKLLIELDLLRTGKQAAESQLAELRGLVAAWYDEEVRDDHENRRNAPGHGHEIPGIWDSDNGAKAGKPCKRCALWFAVRDSRTLAAADGG